MSDDKITISRDDRVFGKQTLTFAKADSLGRVFVMATDDRSRFHMTLDRGEAYRLASFLFGYDEKRWTPLPLKEFGPLAARAPDGSIVVTDEGARWFLNELSRKLGESVIEDLLATATAQVVVAEHAEKTAHPRVAKASGKLDEHGATKLTAYFDPEKARPRTEWIGIALASYTETLRDGFPNARVKVVVTLTPAERGADGD